MGSYTFKWEQPANEVFVTGTFDNWGKTVQLKKKDGIFEKTVELPETGEKVLYKYVVDGTWTAKDTAPTESDGANLNNVLNPSDIVKPATISSAAPHSSSAAMAAEVPKETSYTKSEESGLPGSFPETPFETPAGELQQFSVNPIPATEGGGNPIHLAPGEKVPDPSTFTNNTIHSTVESDNDLKKPEEKEEHAFGVNPIPASTGLGNPIHLAPGEEVPKASNFTANTVANTVSSDSYDKPDALPIETKEAKEPNGMFGVPPVTSTLIPESSLPIGTEGPKDLDAGPHIQSAAPASTTAALAGAVPKEPRGVPEVVTESQREAHVEPEAAANPEAVVEKKEVEAELKKAIPEVPAAATSSTTATKAEAAPVAAVPEEVKESIQAAHTSPEAAANPEAVKEKSAVEAELKKAVPKVDQAGEPAPTATAAVSETAPAPQKTQEGGLSPDALGKEPLKSSNEDIASSKKEPATVLSVTPGEPLAPSTDVSPKTTTPGKPATETAAEEKPTEATASAPATPSKSATTTPTKKEETPDAKKKKNNRISGFFKKLTKKA